MFQFAKKDDSASAVGQNQQVACVKELPFKDQIDGMDWMFIPLMNNKALAYSSDQYKIIDLQTGRTIQLFNDSKMAERIALSADKINSINDKFALVSSLTTIYVLDMQSGQYTHKPIHFSDSRDIEHDHVQVLNDSEFLVTAAECIMTANINPVLSMLHLCVLGAEKPKKSYTLPSAVISTALIDNKHIAIAMENGTELWNFSNGKCVKKLPKLEGRKNWCRLLSINSNIIAYILQNEIKICDVSKGVFVKTLEDEDKDSKGYCLEMNFFIPLHRKNHIVGYVLSNGSQQLKIWDISTGKCQRLFKSNNNPFITHLLNNQLCCSQDGTLKIFDITTFIAEISQSNQASPSPPGNQLVSEMEQLSYSENVKFSSIKLGREINRGGFGIVYEAIYKSRTVAVKQLINQQLNEQVIEDFKKEVAYLSTCISPYIIKFYGACLERMHLSIIMEYMPGGSLYGYAHSTKLFPWNIRYQICIDIALGLSFLHGKGVIHCDVRSPNVLLDENKKAKISDFGLSKTKSANSTFSTIGPQNPYWEAPELVIPRAKPDYRSDVYSYGIVLYEICSRKMPFEGIAPYQMLGLLKDGGEAERREKEHMKKLLEKDTPLTIAALLTQCWDRRAEVRPTINQAVKLLQDDMPKYNFNKH